MQEAFDRRGPSGPDGAAIAAVDVALAHLDPAVHRPAAGEWGFGVPCAGWPLLVGLALRERLLLVQAEALGPGRLDPAWLLHRNRRDLRIVRYGTSAAGAVWVHGELHRDAVTPERTDELLGRIVDAAEAARSAASAAGDGP